MDCTFLSDPDASLDCCICYEVARDPKQEEACGKLFCSSCIDQWEEYSCPACRAPYPRYFFDRKSHREIQALAVLCYNEENGCGWEGTVATLENHEALCGYAAVPCPNNCMECGHLLRKDLEYHLNHYCPAREWTCPHCGMASTYMAITVFHDNVCEKKIVTCSNGGCNMLMERGQVASHVRVSCDYTYVYCKYVSIGCDISDFRMNIFEHEQDSEFHLNLALNKIAKLSEAILYNPFNKEGITFKLTEYSEKNKSKLCHSFQPFFTGPSGYMMSFSVYPSGCGSGKGTHLSVFLEILHGPYDNRLEWPLKAVVSIELLNQEADSSHYTKQFQFTGDEDHCTPGRGSGVGYAEFVALSALPFPAVMNSQGSPAQWLPMMNRTQYSSVQPFFTIGRGQSSYSMLPTQPCSTVNPIQFLKDDTLYFRVTSKVSSHKPWLNHTHE